MPVLREFKSENILFGQICNVVRSQSNRNRLTFVKLAIDHWSSCLLRGLDMAVKEREREIFLVTRFQIVMSSTKRAFFGTIDHSTFVVSTLHVHILQIQCNSNNLDSASSRQPQLRHPDLLR